MFVRVILARARISHQRSTAMNLNEKSRLASESFLCQKSSGIVNLPFHLFQITSLGPGPDLPDQHFQQFKLPLILP